MSLIKRKFSIFNSRFASVLDRLILHRAARRLDGTSFMSKTMPESGSVEYKLAKFVAKEVIQLSQAEVRQYFQYHLKRMRLMFEDGTWKKQLGQFIQLPEYDGKDLANKCFQSAGLIDDNPYLHNCLEAIEAGLTATSDNSSLYAGSYCELMQKMNSTLSDGQIQKSVVLKDCVTLMIVLESLTKAVCENAGLFEKMEHAMGHDSPRLIQYLKNMSELGCLTGVKMSAVQKAARAIMKAEEDGEVKENFSRWLLFINIWMMQFTDSSENGKVANLLSQYMTGKSGGGVGRSQFIESNLGAIEVPHSANVESYSYMYSAWNIALIAQFAAWPFFLPKLFNAEVADVHQNPNSFMHHRVVSLYLFMRWFEHGGGNILSTGDCFDWRCKAMQNTMGTINLENMHKFMDLNCDEAGPTHTMLNRLAKLILSR